MANINRHKVFISYYHKEDKFYKDQLINLIEFNLESMRYEHVFDDYSVRDNDIDDTNLTDEEVRKIIRDEYINDATVLIVLCGEHTKNRKFVDWEIHAAMYHNSETDIRPLGILVVNLPSIKNRQKVISCSDDERNIMDPYANWQTLNKNVNYLRSEYPYLPNRLIENISRDDVSISVVDWDVFTRNSTTIKLFIDQAYKRKDTNKYDFSTKLLRRNLN